VFEAHERLVCWVAFEGSIYFVDAALNIIKVEGSAAVRLEPLLRAVDGLSVAIGILQELKLFFGPEDELQFIEMVY